MDGSFSPGRAIVDIAAGSTLHQIASEIIREINGTALNLDPVWDNVRVLELAGPAGIQLDTSQVPSISQFGQSGAIFDGLTFLLTEVGVTRRFEFDNDGVFSPNNIIISYDDTDTTDELAAEVVSAISSASSGFNIFPRYLGDGVIDVGGTELHGVTLTSNLVDTTLSRGTLSFQIPTTGAQVTGVVDGETFTIADDTTGIAYVFEFNSDPVKESGTIEIPFAFGDSQNDLGEAVVDVVRDVAGLNLNPVYRAGGIVDFQVTTATHTLSFNPTVLVATGVKGARVPHVPVTFSPSEDFTPHDVAVAIVSAVNGTLGLNIQASVGGISTADQRRVELVHTTGFPSDIEFTPDVDGDLKLEVPDDVVKQDQDLVRIIGHSVIDAGPLGYDAPLPYDPRFHLPGDEFGLFSNMGTNLPSYRGLDNQYTGLRLDNFIIGFAERGELVTNADLNDTAFTGNPDGGGRSSGEYQLEIRRGPDRASPLITNSSARSLDTNDREGEGLTLVVQRGLDIADQQTLTISDGVEHVVFEYVDMSIPNNVPQSGRVAIPFLPSDPDYVVAQRVRDAINGPDAQAVLEVTAAISDGTLLGAGDPTPSTSGRVNLFGPVTLTVHATDVDEVNDTMAQATPTGVAGLDSPPFIGSGAIGDNQNHLLRPGLDVDVFEVSLSAGVPLRVDVDANEIGSELDSVLRIFDSAGNQVAFSDDDPAPGEYLRRDPYLLFQPATSGTYYIAVSGYANVAYDPHVEGSGVEGDTGFYNIEITYGASTGSDFVLYDERGDSNLFRDQGQLLIQANTITDSSGYGIVAAAGLRDGQNGDIPHSGPVRMTPKKNDGNLAPGVVIANNVLANNAIGGIRFAGDPNTQATGQTASVPFGRIVNNTISGGGTPAGQLASLINFESLPGGIPAEGTVISDQFLASHGVSFAYDDGTFPILAEVGAPQTAFFPSDTPSASAAGTVGRFFLTDSDGVAGFPGV
ncbi:MAG: PPC domain-containing protein, partial [Planctomycetes bacterium]|nr:PPC domain-containing protein [Planctomycetota bacterium]